MATALFLVCLVFLLCVWDITIKLLIAVRYQWGRLFIDRRIARMSHRLVQIARAYLGLRFEMSYENRNELPDSFVLVSNHQSVADIVALLAFFPEKELRFVAKQSLRKWFPAVSWVLRVQRHALIFREGHGPETARMLRSMAKRAARYRHCLVVFPEGTRSRDGRVGTFHTGALRILLNGASLPVVSVALDGGYRFSHLSQIATRARGGCYRIRVISVHPAPKSKSEMLGTLDRVHQEVRDQIDRWRASDGDV